MLFEKKLPKGNIYFFFKWFLFFTDFFLITSLHNTYKFMHTFLMFTQTITAMLIFQSTCKNCLNTAYTLFSII